MFDVSDRDYYNLRGFGRTIGFGIRPAILSVDFINGFTNENLPLGSRLDDEVAAARRILDAGRLSQLPIYHTVVQYDDRSLADSGVWRLKQAGLSDLIKGSESVDLDRRLGKTPKEAVLVKKYASAFFGTDLFSRLTSLNVDTVLILGCTTSGCVRASAVDAVQYGFRPMVIRQAVGDRSEAAHSQALFDLEQKYADIIDLDVALDYVDQQDGMRDCKYE